MITCPNCGNRNQPGAFRCGNCMTPLSTTEPKTNPKRGGSSMNPTVIISIPQDQSLSGEYSANPDLSIPPLDDDCYSGNVSGPGEHGLHDEFDSGLDIPTTNSIGLDVNPHETRISELSHGHWNIPAASVAPQTSSVSSICPVCHAENLPEYYFCLHCGSKLRASSALSKLDVPINSATTIIEDQQPDASQSPPAIAPSWSDHHQQSPRQLVTSPSDPQPYEQPVLSGNRNNNDVSEKTLMIGSISSKQKGRLTLITEDGSTGERYELGDQTTIGRTTGDIMFPYDGYMSGRHAAIIQRGGSFILKDENSSNGTFVKIRGEVELKPGDVILIGRELFRFEV